MGFYDDFERADTAPELGNDWERIANSSGHLGTWGIREGIKTGTDSRWYKLDDKPRSVGSVARDSFNGVGAYYYTYPSTTFDFADADAASHSGVKGVRFNGNGYISVPPLAGGGTELTVMGWFRPSTLQSAGNPRFLSSSHNDYSDGNGFQLWWNSSENCIQFNVGAKFVVYSGQYKTSAASVFNDDWIHLAGTWSVANGLRLYANGFKVAEQSNFYAAQGIYQSTYPINIGANPSGNGDRYRGLVADVLLYQKELTNNQITQAMFGTSYYRQQVKTTKRAVLLDPSGATAGVVGAVAGAAVVHQIAAQNDTAQSVDLTVSKNAAIDQLSQILFAWNPAERTGYALVYDGHEQANNSNPGLVRYYKENNGYIYSYRIVNRTYPKYHGPPLNYYTTEYLFAGWKAGSENQVSFVCKPDAAIRANRLEVWINGVKTWEGQDGWFWNDKTSQYDKAQVGAYLGFVTSRPWTTGQDGWDDVMVNYKLLGGASQGRSIEQLSTAPGHEAEYGAFLGGGKLPLMGNSTNSYGNAHTDMNVARALEILPYDQPNLLIENNSWAGGDPLPGHDLGRSSAVLLGPW